MHRRVSIKGTKAAFALAAVAVALPAATPAVSAAEAVAVALVIKDHRFTPAEIRVPAGQPVTITVTNQDATAEELESRALKVEKVVAGGGTATVHVRPLDKGSYPFVGEYHEDTAKGTLIAE